MKPTFAGTWKPPLPLPEMPFFALLYGYWLVMGFAGLWLALKGQDPPLDC